VLLFAAWILARLALAVTPVLLNVLSIVALVFLLVLAVTRLSRS
jgi:hypothetical protein